MTAYANSAIVPWQSYWDQIKVVNMSNGVTTLCPYAFHGCKYLTKAIIGGFITSIGPYAFYNCQSLTSITIPETVTSIGDYAFTSCISLESVSVPDTVTSIGDYAFFGCTSLASANVPDFVTTIASHVFSNCTSLTTVTLGNSVETIGYAAFSYTALTSVIIPDSVITISKDAFYKCTSLTSVTLGKSVASIGDYAFQLCTKLSTVNNASSLTLTIGSTGKGFVAYYATDVYYSCEYILNAYLGNASQFTGVKALCDTQTKTAFNNSVQFTLPAVPERTDNTCVGWSDTSTPGDTAQYAAGDTIALTRTDSSVRTVTKEVYATWPNSFSYTLQHGDWGSGSDVTKTVTNSVFMVGTSVIPAALFSAPVSDNITGTIGKWKLVSGSEYVNETEVNPGSSFTVKKCPPPGTSIVWKAIWYGVAQYAYDLNGGSSSTTLGPQTVATGEWNTYVQVDAAVLPTASTLTAPSGTTSAARFKTWRRQMSSGTVDIGEGGSYSETIPIPWTNTWKAIWADTATWTLTGGKYGSGSNTVSEYHELGMKVPNVAPTKRPTGITAPVSGGVTGTLAKWTENGVDVELGADISITVPGTRTLDAVWNGTTTITYDPGLGDGEEWSDILTAEWGTAVIRELESFEIEGVDFSCPDDAINFKTWRVEKYGDLDPGDVIDMIVPSTTTATAIWMGAALLRLYSGVNGSGWKEYWFEGEYNIEVEYTLPTATEVEFTETNGCSFKEWAYSDGSRISAGEKIKLTYSTASNLDLTAIWQGKPYIHYLSGKSASTNVSKFIDDSSDTIENTESAKLTVKAVSGGGFTFTAPTSCEFDRWSGNDNNTYQPGDTVTLKCSSILELTPIYAGYVRIDCKDVDNGTGEPILYTGSAVRGDYQSTQTATVPDKTYETGLTDENGNKETSDKWYTDDKLTTSYTAKQEVILTVPTVLVLQSPGFCSIVWTDVNKDSDHLSYTNPQISAVRKGTKIVLPEITAYNWCTDYTPTKYTYGTPNTWAQNAVSRTRKRTEWWQLHKYGAVQWILSSDSENKSPQDQITVTTSTTFTPVGKDESVEDAPKDTSTQYQARAVTTYKYYDSEYTQQSIVDPSADTTDWYDNLSDAKAELVTITLKGSKPNISSDITVTNWKVE